MAQWKSADQANGAPIWAAAQLKVTPNTGNQTALYGNTTSGGFIAGETIGVYGVSAAEAAAQLGKIAHSGWVLRKVGSGGRANRIQTEVLVAGGISSDGENTAFPEATITILTQPSSTSANATTTVTFTVVAAVAPVTVSPTYAWTYANGDSLATGANVGNTTQATLTVNTEVQNANASFKVRVMATGATNATSSNATLTITA